MFHVHSVTQSTESGGVSQVRESVAERILWWLAYGAWRYMFVLGAAVFLVALLGLWIEYHVDDVEFSASGLIFHAAQLFLLHAHLDPVPSNLFLKAVGYLAPFFVFLTAAKALAGIFREQVLGIVIWAFYKKHVIICGLGRKGRLFVKEFRENGERVLVIEKDKDNEMIPECENLSAPVLIGRAEDRNLLRKANVAQAKGVICVCGEDGTNAEIALHVRELLENRKGEALTCLVHVFGPELAGLLRAHMIEMGRVDSFRLEFFNIFRTAGWLFLKDWEPPLREPGTDSSTPHFLVVCMGRLGESVVVQAARKWWTIYEATGKRLFLTIIDKRAGHLVKHLYSKYSDLERSCDIDAIDIEIDSAEFETAEYLEGRDGRGPITLAFLCMGDQQLALTCAIRLANKTRHRPIPLVVRFDYEAGFGELLTTLSAESPNLKSVKSFGLFSQTCRTGRLHEIAVERLAQAIHMRYLESQRRSDGTFPDKPSVVPWRDLSKEAKESNRRQADHIGAKLRLVGCSTAPRTDWDAPLFEFSKQEIEVMAEDEHKRWYEEKIQSGYKPGPVRDEANKIHDCLVDWKDLSEEQKEVDRIAVREIPKLMAGIDLDIYRVVEKRL